MAWPVLDYWSEIPSRKAKLESRNLVLRYCFWICSASLTVLILAAMTVPHFDSGHPTSQKIAAMNDISKLKLLLEIFQSDNGRYPTTAEGLQALTANPGNLPNWRPLWTQSLLLPLDPWGNPYVYRSPGSNGLPYDIFSAGPDGVVGTEDDISW